MERSPIEKEIERIDGLGRELLSLWAKWGDQIEWGREYNTYYGDTIRFVNFRMETVETCLNLVKMGKIPDALGLCRALLENLLLLRLLCAGTKFYRVEELTGAEAARPAEALQQRREELAEAHAKGEQLARLMVDPFPGNARKLLHVFVGYTDETDPDFKIPAHHFVFQNFHPEVMRLNPDDYFDYMDPEESVTAAQKRHRKESAAQHIYYLSYGGLLRSLGLNGIVGEAERLRVEAHYTFLGRFLHPTHDAAQELLFYPNTHNSHTAIGSDQRYASAAVLLASLYATRLAVENVRAVTGLLKGASSKRVQDAHAEDLERLAEQTESSTKYFWLLGDEATLYDKFNWGIHFATDEELVQWGDYEGAPSDRIKFTINVYAHLKDCLGGWSNRRVGRYDPPLR